MPDIRKLNFNLLLTFDMLMEHRNISEVAGQLELSQSAVSQSVARLREFFGDALFIRGSRGVVPTQRAIAIAPQVRHLLEGARELMNIHAAFDPATAETMITLHGHQSGQAYLVPSILKRLRAQAPSCQLRVLHLNGHELERGLETGDVHIAIDGRLRFSHGVVQQKLFDQALVMVAHESRYPNGTISLDEFSAARHVGWLASSLQFADIAAEFTALGATIRPLLLTPHINIVPTVIAANPDMVACLPTTLLKTFGNLCGLKAVTPTFPTPASFGVYMYWHQLHAEEPMNIWLRQLIKQTFATKKPAGA